MGSPKGPNTHERAKGKTNTHTPSTCARGGVPNHTKPLRKHPVPTNRHAINPHHHRAAPNTTARTITDTASNARPQHPTPWPQEGPLHSPTKQLRKHPVPANRRDINPHHHRHHDIERLKEKKGVASATILSTGKTTNPIQQSPARLREPTGAS